MWPEEREEPGRTYFFFLPFFLSFFFFAMVRTPSRRPDRVAAVLSPGEAGAGPSDEL